MLLRFTDFGCIHQLTLFICCPSLGTEKRSSVLSVLLSLGETKSLEHFSLLIIMSLFFLYNPTQMPCRCYRGKVLKCLGPYLGYCNYIAKQ
ncbi:hypothetical protein M441DRAFT_351612 [Trichoderma asperellum CBS 433.97]|uniref:Uncharacterized protein n=1 Tax=Trichoderma asperellum (strain ATCC 204424 / CBS 433.97 / NBRC 101777) TaxID=1042311 RepID=A0A2T3ZII2_TRIA4|nr:hypothetical protein M441DRAFT_351612 [Trichoderma asperellum CBS 433.97]PTB44573.1 hypothetical protein M441DRAFT_351612 [Trichoderma asperellum CBS 433.97]WVH32719.1 major transforming protein [Trichoderma asperellum]